MGSCFCYHFVTCKTGKMLHELRPARQELKGQCMKPVMTREEKMEKRKQECPNRGNRESKRATMGKATMSHSIHTQKC